MVKGFGYFAYHEWASQEAKPLPHVPRLRKFGSLLSQVAQRSMLPAKQAWVFAGSEWLGEALLYLGLLPQRLAVVVRAAVGCPRVSEDGEGWSNPSPGKQFSLVQIPNGGGDQGYFTCP